MTKCNTIVCCGQIAVMWGMIVQKGVRCVACSEVFSQISCLHDISIRNHSIIGTIGNILGINVNINDYLRY